MATVQSFINLGMQVQGAEQAAALADRIDILRDKVNRLNAVMQANPQHAASMTLRLNQMTNEITSAQRKLGELVASKGNAYGGGAGMMNLGQMVQDFQAAGFRGISNQLDRFVLSLGGSAGLAGAVMLAGAAFEAFRPKIMQFLEGLKPDALQSFVGHLDTLKERLEALKDNTDRSASEEMEMGLTEKAIERFQRGEKAFEKFKEARSDSEKGLGSLVTDALESPEARAALDDMAAFMGRDGGSAKMQDLQGKIDAITKEIDNPSKTAGITYGPGAGNQVKEIEAGLVARRAKLQDELKKAQLDHEKTVQSDVGNMMADAAGGSPEAVSRLLDTLGAMGRTDLRDELMNRIEAPGKETIKLRDELGKKSQNEFAGMLEAEGEKNEKFGEAKVKFDKWMDKWKQETADKGSDIVEKYNRAELVERRDKAEKYAKMFWEENKPRAPQVFGDAMSYINSMQTAGALTPQHETNQILRDIAQKFDRQIQLIEDAGGLVVEP
jgi:hypothetical protein